MLAGLEEPTAGQISINDERVTGPGLDRGVVFQDFALFPWLTVSENIAFGLRSMGMTRAEQSRRVKYYTELVGLSKFEDYYPNRLSGGMRQRVGLGRALAIEPALLLMDEPFSALDAQTREAMQNSLSDIWMRTKKTVLFVTHDIREAIFLSDRVLVLNGEPSEITLEMGIDLPRPRDRHHPEFQAQEAILERAIAGEFQKEPRSAPNR
ncbi:uncharacterized protein METZ01_LOCUS414417 [marine metagenome]|uniref:ABC transporter domain-containing protein n=1 Tax=marine metagenome TaxID=408172 RepID=A0A382WSA1_9ZZZZ